MITPEQLPKPWLQQSGTKGMTWQPLQTRPVTPSSQQNAINLITPESLPATPATFTDRQFSTEDPVRRPSQLWTATSSSQQPSTNGPTSGSYQSNPDACLYCRKQGPSVSTEQDPFVHSAKHHRNRHRSPDDSLSTVPPSILLHA